MDKKSDENSMGVWLASVGNPDHGQDPGQPMYGCAPNQMRPVDSIEHAQRVVLQWIQENRLGGGNWAGGAVVSCGKAHTVLGRISYNGKYWISDETVGAEAPEVSGQSSEPVEGQGHNASNIRESLLKVFGAGFRRAVDMVRDPDDRYGIGSMASQWTAKDVADDLIKRFDFAAEFRRVIADRDTPVIDLDAISWAAINQAASESKWIPKEYFANDWLSDVCDFLRNGPPATPRVIVDLSGGAWHGVASDSPVQVLLVDFDPEGCDADQIWRLEDGSSACMAMYGDDGDREIDREEVDELFTIFRSPRENNTAKKDPSL